MSLQGKDLPPFTRVKIQKRYTGKPDVETVAARWNENYHRFLKILQEKIRQRGYDLDDIDLQPTSDSYLIIDPDGEKIAEVKRALFEPDEERKIIKCNFYYRIFIETEGANDNQEISS